MKKLLMLFAVVAFLGTTVNAQCTKGKTVGAKKTCTKGKTACTKGKTASASMVSLSAEEMPACSVAAAAKLASLDANIESRTCAKSGHTAYYKKNTCAQSGKTTFQQVEFNRENRAFVNVAPSAKGEVKAVQVNEALPKKTCSKAEKKACTKGAKTASAMNVANPALPAKKTCSKGKKACCASKKAAGKTVSTSNEGQVKLINNVEK